MTDRPNTQDFPSAEADVQEITALITAIETGFNDKDPAVLDGVFAADAVVVAPDGTMLRGWDELFAYHKTRLSGPANGWRISTSVLDVGFLGATSAIVQVRQDMTTPDGGFSNHGTAVAKKVNGVWWLCSFHNTRIVA
ncbi:SgcJ/EcaC family oxidoreductase [Saccharopolyspora taberi]|uniref:DUF4440 domain-containing protein n=1 Tax=Saccharopolyspora taberi TaxID=60895 RepID=A0ABN3V4K8_9PSEU